MKQKGKLCNRGSSLILVIIGAAFLGIMGALILSITYTNINLKQVDNASKKNFYIEEVAVNEVTATLEQYCEESMRNVYNWLVENYAKDDIAKQLEDKEWRKRFMVGLSQKLNEKTINISGDLETVYKVNTLRSGIKSNADKVQVAVYLGKDQTAENGTIEYSLAEDGVTVDYKNMTLKNVSITYTDATNYETNIVTDINVEIPSSGTVDTTFSKFALISDKLIYSTATKADVYGGVYGGITSEEEIGVGNGGDAVNPNRGGIWVDGSGVKKVMNIYGNGNIVAARANITISDSAKLTIKNAKVWAENIMTFGKGGVKGTDETVETSESLPKVVINATTKVEDDLIVKGTYSRVELGGQYYGFSCKSKDKTNKTSSNTSSAITVNAKQVGLDFSGLDVLAVFGRAFISSKIGNSVDGDAFRDKMMDILMGQTLALKYDQGQYLVPNDSCLKIPMNPITLDRLNIYAIERYEADRAKYPSFDPSIPYFSLDMKTDITDFTKGYEKNVLPYLDPDEPIKAIYYHQGTGEAATNMVNFYYNFKDDQSANDYFKWYYTTKLRNGNTTHSQELEETFEQFFEVNGSSCSLKFKDFKSMSRFQFAGDVLYRKADNTYEVYNGDASKESLEALDEESMEFQKKYQSVQLNLRENGGTVDKFDKSKNPYVGEHFDIKGIKNVNKEAGFVSDGRGNDYLPITTTVKSTKYGVDAKVYVSNATTFTVTDEMRAGIVIASGDVVVKAGRFEGVIIAAGKITVENSTELMADEKMVLDVLKYCYQNGNQLKNYIPGYKDITRVELGDYSLDYGKAITFENWRKNA